jgi:hypothetical protein
VAVRDGSGFVAGTLRIAAGAALCFRKLGFRAAMRNRIQNWTSNSSRCEPVLEKIQLILRHFDAVAGKFLAGSGGLFSIHIPPEAACRANASTVQIKLSQNRKVCRRGMTPALSVPEKPGYRSRHFVPRRRKSRCPACIPIDSARETEIVADVVVLRLQRELHDRVKLKTASAVARWISTCLSQID